MKRIIFLVVLLFALSIGIARAFEFDKTPNSYDRGDVSQYNASLNFLRLGLLEKAVETAFSIKDYELKWMMLYAISTDGYASRGKIEEAVALMEEVIDIFKEVSGVRKNFESYLNSNGQRFMGDVIVAAVEGGYWEKSLPVFSKLSRQFYYFQAVEKVILRLPNKEVIEDFLAKMDYSHILSWDNSFMYFKGSYHLIILWDDNREVRTTYHKLTQKQQREFLSSR